MMLQYLSMNQEQVEASKQMPMSPREDYLPNLPVDEQRHRLAQIAISCIQNRDYEGSDGPYLINTYLGKFILTKDPSWEVEWLKPHQLVTLRQGSKGTWGEGPLPNRPTM